MTLLRRLERAGIDPFGGVVGALLAIKLLFARYLIFGHWLGFGAFTDILAVLAVIGLSGSAGRWRGRKITAVVSLAFSLIALSTVVYSSYFDQMPTLRMLTSIREGGELVGSVIDLLSWWHVLLVVDLPVILFVAFRTKRDAEPRRFRLGLLGTNALVAFIALAVAAYPTDSRSDSMTSSYRHGILAFELSTLVGRDGPELGGFGANVAVAAAKSPGAADHLQRQIDQLTTHRDGPRVPDVPAAGSMRGKNLIIIQAESLQAGLVGARVNGQPIVPNLERLIDESIYFPNTYSQIGRGNTADAEFIANTSLYPPSGEPASVAYARKQIPSLPRLFEKQGYEADTFHTNDAQFWNRFQLYPALGFDRYFDRAYFGTSDVTGYGASDQVLFYKTWEKLLVYHEQHKKFYAQVVTLSAHYPYGAVCGRGQIEMPREFANTSTARYLESQNYFDQQLGSFVDFLRASGILDDTVLVVYGDHFGMRFKKATRADGQLRRMVFGRRYTQADYFNIPLVIRVPGDTPPSRQETPLGQIDIMPTMADLFGLDLSSTPHFGRSGFVKTKTVLAKGNCSSLYIDDDMMFITGLTGAEDLFYDSHTQQRMSGPQLSRPARFENVADILRLSETYGRSLPERPSATDNIGVIPNAKKTPGVKAPVEPTD